MPGSTPDIPKGSDNSAPNPSIARPTLGQRIAQSELAQRLGKIIGKKGHRVGLESLATDSASQHEERTASAMQEVTERQNQSPRFTGEHLHVNTPEQLPRYLQVEQHLAAGLVSVSGISEGDYTTARLGYGDMSEVTFAEVFGPRRGKEMGGDLVINLQGDITISIAPLRTGVGFSTTTYGESAYDILQRRQQETPPGSTVIGEFHSHPSGKYDDPSEIHPIEAEIPRTTQAIERSSSFLARLAERLHIVDNNDPFFSQISRVLQTVQPPSVADFNHMLQLGDRMTAISAPGATYIALVTGEGLPMPIGWSNRQQIRNEVRTLLRLGRLYAQHKVRPSSVGNEDIASALLTPFIKTAAKLGIALYKGNPQEALTGQGIKMEKL